MKKNQTKELAYMALYVALCVIFEVINHTIPLFQMPNGGSLELGYVALFVASFQLGWKKGIIVGLLWWLIGYILGFNLYFLNPMQYALDYLIPVVACGAVSLVFHGKQRNVFFGVILGIFLKFVSTVLSGVYYWPPEETVAGSGAAWAYSLSYNTFYNLATGIGCVILVPLVITALKHTHVSFAALTE